MERVFLLVPLVVSLVSIGVTLYVLELHTPRNTYTAEELMEMDKFALVSLILEQRSSVQRLGKVVFPLVIILSSLATSFVIYILFRRKKVDKQVLLDMLPEEERSVIKVLLQTPRLKQFELARLVDMNKVKLHRVLKRMEEGGIVRTVRVGRYNLVELSEDVRQLFQIK